MPIVRRMLATSSIRSRLIALVLAVWVPAVIGLGLQTWGAYQREEEGARERIRQLAVGLGTSVQAELDRRQFLAHVLAGSLSLRNRDLAEFEDRARHAIGETSLHVFLVDRTHQHFYTGQPNRQRIQRRPGSLFVEQGMGVAFMPEGLVPGKPVIGILVPESGVQPPQFNVGVPFPPEAVQEVLGRQSYPEGGVAAVLDAQQRVMARSRDPQRWLGQRASNPALLALASARGSDFVYTTTLDGVASLTYLSAPTPQGWQSLVALPVATLEATARRLAFQAMAVSALLLAIGLALAIVVARRISRPVEALGRAAGELLAQRVPEPLATGIVEIDRVGDVLHDAGLRSRQSERVLEERVARAITETREAEARLFDARKHEAIGRLSGGIAHDFNNLLQTISTGLQVVQRSVPEGRHSRPLQAALSACAKAADVVRQMLAFGRAQQLQLQPVNVVDLLLRSRELTGKALGERIRLVADLAPSLPSAMADPTQLELALLNLVFNARDAMPEGGAVRIRGRVADGMSLGLGQGEFLCIEVEDDGEGMDAGTMARVFEPYFTTKPVGKGSGLGLPQVQAFARQSGGDVRISSAPGQGTCVTMILPTARGHADAREPAPAAPARKRRALRVVMVEDDVLVASVVPVALEQEGHRVTLCRTADEARLLLAGGMAFDVLFTDIVMPGSMTGIELVAWCREHLPELPTMVATGYSDRTPEGVWKLLRKPYTVEDLLDALEVVTVARASV